MRSSWPPFWHVRNTGLQAIRTFWAFVNSIFVSTILRGVYIVKFFPLKCSSVSFARCSQIRCLTFFDALLGSGNASSRIVSNKYPCISAHLDRLKINHSSRKSVYHFFAIKNYNSCWDVFYISTWYIYIWKLKQIYISASVFNRKNELVLTLLLLLSVSKQRSSDS